MPRSQEYGDMNNQDNNMLPPQASNAIVIGQGESTYIC